ncbi:MAG: hypothetical protein EAZ89_13615 [Bacteroidetes bacterium]|jgi:hypothetical protein|nr:MAG: hypothetical protein EAZ89_13615 [Bacteroidota bacterium]
MVSYDLQTRIQLSKDLLQKEIVRNRTSGVSTLSFREISVKMDLLHEVERVGIRNLGENEERKLTRMITELEKMFNISPN